ncbi:response regulator [Amycolatopsis nigrescens]|uniref:response regulator n=1 Tax=Amycolatopsis nigrescens TaxID=381445 RepID=UPI000368CEC0|nr:response regulator transcription factor [Amycolatopsis nigrescens]
MTKPGGAAVRVLIVDDDPMIRGALREVLESESDIEVIAEAGDAVEAVSLGELHLPTVAVLDVRMTGGGGLLVARELSRRSPDTRLMVFSAYDDAGARQELARAGVRSYLIKGVSNREIVETVRRLGAPGMQ